MTHIAIIGTGVIGTGWTARLLANGYNIKAWDPSDNFDSRLIANIKRLWPTLEKYGITSNASLSNLSTGTSLDAACDGAMLVQESATEDLVIKKHLHKKISGAISCSTIIASSSSGLLPTEIQVVYEDPEKFIIGHPFNPVYLLPLVEIVGGEKPSQQTIESAKNFYTSIGLYPLVVRKEIEGYLADSLQEAQWREILHLVNDDVATTGEIDDAIIYGPGLRWAMMGTCLTFHLAGGNSGMRHMLKQFGPSLKLPWTKLEAPELTDGLIEKMVDGTLLQAGDQSIEELEELRDSCLIEIIQALKKFQIGAGKLR